MSPTNCDRRVDLVGDAGGELADGLELLRQAQLGLHQRVLGLRVHGLGDVEHEALQLAPVGAVGEDGAGRAQPDLLAAGLDEAKLDRWHRRAAGGGGDRHAQAPLVVLGHVAAEPLQAAARGLLGADARDRQHLRADVDRRPAGGRPRGARARRPPPGTARRAAGSAPRSSRACPARGRSRRGSCAG